LYLEKNRRAAHLQYLVICPNISAKGKKRKEKKEKRKRRVRSDRRKKERRNM